jgi:YesN/AraC family two-component response regulator
MMPEINGLKLCEMIKRNLQTCHIPVILLSAKSSLDDQTSGIELGADDYIGKPFSMTLLKGKINNILKSKERIIHFYQNNVNVDTAEVTSNSADNEFVRRTIQIIEENISNDNFSTDDLANQLCMSRSNLYIKMNSIAGEPPANFIRRIRFNKVCKLLLEEKYSIAEISYMTGFSSPSYLSNSFKKFMGMLPSEYIKEHRNNG